MLRGIVFDFDGVIANSEPLHFRAYRDVLAANAIDLPEAEYYARYLGYDDYGAFVAIAADRRVNWPRARIDELIRQKAVRMEELERDASVLFPGAEAAIRAAAGAVPVAIASGALGAEIRRVLDRAGLAQLFTAVVAAEDTPASKPAPDPYIRAVELLGGMRADECLAIEDSHWGLESAQAAGLRTLAVAQTYPADRLRTADLVIPSMLQFDLAIVQRLF